MQSTTPVTARLFYAFILDEASEKHPSKTSKLFKWDLKHRFIFKNYQGNCHNIYELHLINYSFSL